MEKIIECSVSSVSGVADLIPGGKMQIELDPAAFIPGLPAAPKVNVKAAATSISVTIKQTCPGYPACGRSAACVIRKSTPALDLTPAINLSLPIPNMPSLPKIPKLTIPISLPSIGFSSTCPNSQHPVSTEDRASQTKYANSGETAPQ